MLLRGDSALEVTCIKRQVSLVSKYTICLLHNLLKGFVSCNHILNLIWVVVQIFNKLTMVVSASENFSCLAFKLLHFPGPVVTRIQNLLVGVFIWYRLYYWWF